MKVNNDIVSDYDFLSRKFIVFGKEHYNPLGVVRSLGEYGIRSILIVLKSKPRCASLSKYVKECYFVDSVEQGYGILLERFGSEVKKPFVFTCDDLSTEYMDARYEEVKDKFIFNNAGQNCRISYFLDKYNILCIAQECGLNTLKAWTADKGEIPDDIEFPVITKSISPNSGGWKSDVHICHSKEELLDAYSKIASPKVLLQRYIEKKNELCLDGFSVAKGEKTFVAIASDYHYLIPDTYSSYMRVFNFDDAELREKIDLLLKKIGFEGIFSIEFLIDRQGNEYFSEVNFRNSTWSYAATCAGMPLPVLWAKSMLSGEIDDGYTKIIPDGFDAMVEFADFRARVLTKKIGLREWIKQKKSCKCLYYKGRRDPKPYRAKLRHAILHLFKRKK